VDGSGYQKFKQAVQAQGGNPQALDKFELLPMPPHARSHFAPRAGYVSLIKAEDIGSASNMIGAGRDRKETWWTPPWALSWNQVGEKVEAGSVLCRLITPRRPRGGGRRNGGGRLPHLRPKPDDRE